MTMPKREVNSIWAKVRDDVDIDDLIFNYEAYHAGEDDGCSDRGQQQFIRTSLMKICKTPRLQPWCFYFLRRRDASPGEGGAAPGELW